MRGKQNKEQTLFCYTSLEDLVPKNHILRKIDSVISFKKVWEETEDLYSHTGRPSIDPEVMIRMLVIGYLKGITSERRLCEEVQLNLAYRWFCGLSLEDKIPDHSTFSKNRYGRFSGTDIFRNLFVDIVKQAQSHGLVQGKHLSVDASTIEANASMASLEPIVVNMDGNQYLNEICKNNLIHEEIKSDKINEEKKSNETYRSSTDPDARIYKKKNSKSKLAYSHNILMDNKNRVILDVEVTTPNLYEEGQAAVNMVKRSRFKYNINPESIGGDSAYGFGACVHGLCEIDIKPHVSDPTQNRKNNIFHPHLFKYNKELGGLVCPAGKFLRKKLDIPEQFSTKFTAKRSDCSKCNLKSQCTTALERTVSLHWYRTDLDFVKSLRNTKEFEISQKCRKKIEHLFGEAKEFLGFRKARRRGFKNIEEQSLMTCMVQNIKRIVNSLKSRPLDKVISSLNGFYDGFIAIYEAFERFLKISGREIVKYHVLQIIL